MSKIKEYIEELSIVLDKEFDEVTDEDIKNSFEQPKPLKNNQNEYSSNNIL